MQSNNQIGKGIVLFIFRFGVKFSPGISSVQIQKFATILSSQQIKLSLLFK